MYPDIFDACSDTCERENLNSIINLNFMIFPAKNFVLNSNFAAHRWRCKHLQYCDRLDEVALICAFVENAIVFVVPKIAPLPPCTYTSSLIVSYDFCMTTCWHAECACQTGSTICVYVYCMTQDQMVTSGSPAALEAPAGR